MNKYERKFSKIEYTKKILLDEKFRTCRSCKYNWRNYRYPNKDLESMAIDYFTNKCKTGVNNR